MLVGRLLENRGGVGAPISGILDTQGDNTDHHSTERLLPFSCSRSYVN